MDLTIDNVTQPLAEWAMDYGIPCALIRDRLAKGWTAERAVTEPTRKIAYRLTAADMKDVPSRPKISEAKPFAYGNAQRFVGIIEHNGKSMSVQGWSDCLGISKQVITYRLRKGYPLSMVLDAELRRGKRPPKTLH